MTMPKYKLLAIDIDDTLLPRGGVISERNKRAIKRAEEAGVYVTLATGRGYHGASPVREELGIERLVINYGGAIINDPKTGKPFMTTELEPETVNYVLELAEELGLHAHLYQGDGIVYEREHHYGSAYSEHLDLPKRIEPNIRKMVWHNVPKVLIITEPERVEGLLPYFEEKLRGKAAVSASSPGFIEFNKIGASKGSALRLLAEHLGIPREETAAIGDNTLDREMIEWAGLGACVEGGNSICKAVADVIVPSCEEDGVAVFIEKYLLKEDEMISIGFDVGGTTVKGGAVSKDDRILRKIAKPTPFGDAEALCALIKEMADELSEGAELEAVGVTVPGSVRSDGSIIDAWNIGVHDFPLKKRIEELIPAKRVIVRNDADAAGAAELLVGSLKGVTTGLMLTLGTGVGGALILGGKLFTGGLNRGTEPGHAMLERGGVKCGCGHCGCIETLCSAMALKRKAEIAAKYGGGLISRRAKNGETVDAKLLIDCARAGDGTAKALFEEYVDALADAIATFVNILDPEVISIGGGVSGAGEMLLAPLRELVPGKCFFGSCGKIVAATAGNDAGILGSIT
jgi:glucokinase